MEIKSISEKIFKTASRKAESNNNSHSNPFGVNFKGNIISADVFETSEKQNITFKGAELAAKAGAKCKMLKSAFVGSIGEMSSALKTRFNNVLDRITSSRIGQSISGACDYLNNHKAVLELDWNLKIVEGKARNWFNMIIGKPYEGKNVDELGAVMESLTNARVTRLQEARA